MAAWTAEGTGVKRNPTGFWMRSQLFIFNLLLTCSRISAVVHSGAFQRQSFQRIGIASSSQIVSGMSL
jgi:hypothetical protein